MKAKVIGGLNEIGKPRTPNLPFRNGGARGAERYGKLMDRSGLPSVPKDFSDTTIPKPPTTIIYEDEDQ